MTRKTRHVGRLSRRINFIAFASLGLLIALTLLMFKPARHTAAASGRSIQLFCAAGMRLPIEAIRTSLAAEYGVQIDVQYGGSMTLLSQLQISRVADLYLAADDDYLEMGIERGVIGETIPIASMVPVIVVAPGNPKGIKGIDDLLSPELRVALGNPDQAAIGRRTRAALQASGHWERLKEQVTRSGVFKPTVPDVANCALLGSVDAAIVWSATASQYAGLDSIHTPELDAFPSEITLGVTSWSDPPAAALHAARYITARDRGLPVFARMGYDAADGDPWAAHPELTFFAGSVNRRALEPVIQRFEDREGVTINTIYNGCGILTAQMRTLGDPHATGFPDVYIACDKYYLDTVAELFELGTCISETDIVLVVAEGNPKHIRQLDDLTRPGIRVAIGQPEQCTIGVLSKRLLEDAGLYQTVLTSNVVTQTATSSMLIPAVTTGAADVVLAYRTDTLAETARTDVVDIDSELAKAIQPFAIAKGTEYKALSQRLFNAIKLAQDDFEAAGFRWRLVTPTVAPAQVTP